MIDRLISALLVVILATAFCLGVRLIYVAPPFVGQDELYHWQRALQISEGTIFAQRLAENNYGGPIDKAGYEFCLWPLKHFQDKELLPRAETQRLANALAQQPKAWTTVAFSSTASFSPLAYIPQAFGIFVARSIGGNVLGQVAAGRLGNFIVYGAMTKPRRAQCGWQKHLSEAVFW